MFSVLTSKIYGAAAVALTLTLALVILTKNSTISSLQDLIKEQAETIALQRQDIQTLVGNADKLEFGLTQCNAGVRATAEAATRVASAGAAAVEQVRAAGVANLEASRRRLDALPRDGATAAELCEQADALLLQGAE